MAIFWAYSVNMNIGTPAKLSAGPCRTLPNQAKSYQKFPRIVTYTFVGLDELPGFDTHILPEMTQNLPGFAHT